MRSNPNPSSAAARWTAVSIFALASAWNYLDRFTLSNAGKRIIDEFHLSNAGYGWLLSAFNFSYALASPAVGWFLDRLLGSSPWGLIIFMLLGFAAGVLNVVRSTGAGQGGASGNGAPHEEHEHAAAGDDVIDAEFKEAK